MKQQETSRRIFLKAAASTVAVPMIIPRSFFADAVRPGANDRIGLAGIGVGRQGGGVFVGNAEANKLLRCEHRKGFELPAF
ncbi:MAG: hypothetical protein LBT05_11825 [Planctomycetaceae bacterium]|jgi:hypothetical protein|nr:hypothetical protein [Planctomycetaceae bacterium]